MNNSKYEYSHRLPENRISDLDEIQRTFTPEKKKNLSIKKIDIFEFKQQKNVSDANCQTVKTYPERGTLRIRVIKLKNTKSDEDYTFELFLLSPKGIVLDSNKARCEYQCAEYYQD